MVLLIMSLPMEVVMLIDGAFITEMNAQDIANILQDVMNNKSEEFFRLDCSPASGDMVTFWVRPLPSEAIYDLEDSSQIVKCETDGGRGLSILVPRMNREFLPATVVLSKSSGE